MPGFPDGLAPGLVIVPILAALIIIHELGHFWAARSVGVKVEEFGIGIPPRAKGWKRGGVTWSLNWIPFGGFVRVKGEDGADFEPGSMNTKGPLQRAFFLSAGSAMNFLAAIVIAIVLIAFQGIPILTQSVYVTDVNATSPAATAGWQPGDRIVEVNGQEIASSTQLQAAIEGADGKPVEVVIGRGDERLTTSVTPRQNPPDGQGATGISMIAGEQSRINITDVLPGSAAAQAGWRDGDKIVAINGIPIEAEEQARGLLTDATGSNAVVTLDRDGNRVDTTISVPRQYVVLTSVARDTPASEALLYAQDQIESINGVDVEDGPTLLQVLSEASGKTVPVEVQREGQPATVSLAVPAISEGSNPLGVIGANARIQSPYEVIGTDAILSRVYERVPASRVVPEGTNLFWDVTSGTFLGFKKLLTEGVDRNDLTGPVGMGQMTSELLSSSANPPLLTVGMIMIVISVALGVLNLIPFPALDGGRLLFVLIEVLRGGRKISPEKEGLVHLAGMVILFGMMIFVAFGDIDRLADGRSLLP